MHKMILSCIFLVTLSFSDCSWLEEYFGTNHTGNYLNNLYSSIIGYDVQQPPDFLRPCDFTDFDCMRSFLATNSQCRPAYGPTPDSVLLPLLKFYFPVANMTITHTGVAVSGFKSAKITEFFVNLATGNVVISFNTRNLNLTADKSFLTYQRVRKEPITKADRSTFQLASVSFTATIPKIPSLKLDKANIHADTFKSQLSFSIGQKAFASSDPEVVAEIAAFKANPDIAVKEELVYHSYYLTTTFIQTQLCDFGVNAINANNPNLQGIVASPGGNLASIGLELGAAQFTLEL